MTAQIHERIVVDGEETSMSSCPSLPRGHPRLTEPEKPWEGETDRLVFSTACWRRYRGSWEIKDGKLYLVDVRGRFRLEPGEPLFADWYSGLLTVPRGDMLRYVHMGFESIYDREVHYLIHKGEVISEREVKFDPDKLPPED